MNTRHAVFAVCVAHDGTQHTFRVGRPVDLARAHARWNRLDRRTLSLRFERKRYTIRFVEVRAVDRHGRGLGRPDHDRAMHVPYRALVGVGLSSL